MDKKTIWKKLLLFFLPKFELAFKYFYNHLNTNELYSMNLKPWT